jgi:tetratricopeptide (TPR) repeat protein
MHKINSLIAGEAMVPSPNEKRGSESSLFRWKRAILILFGIVGIYRHQKSEYWSKTIVTGNDKNLLTRIIDVALSPITQSESFCDLLLAEADEFRKRGECAFAYTRYLSYIVLSGDNPKAFFGAVRCTFALNKQYELLDYFNVMKRKEASNPNFLFGLGAIYFQLGDFAKTIYYLRLSLRQNGNNIFALEILAELYIKKGKYIKALIYLKQYMANARRMRDKKSYAYCYNNIGYCYACLGLTDRALVNYKFALHWSQKFIQKEQYGQICLNLGDLYFLIGDTLRAKYHYSLALHNLDSENALRGVALALERLAIVKLSEHQLFLANKLFKCAEKLAKLISDFRLIAEIETFRVYFAIIKNRLSKKILFIDRVYAFNSLLHSNSFCDPTNLLSPYMDINEKIVVIASCGPDLSENQHTDIVSKEEIFGLDCSNALKTHISFLKSCCRNRSVAEAPGMENWILITLMHSTPDNNKSMQNDNGTLRESVLEPLWIRLDKVRHELNTSQYADVKSNK